MGVRTKDWIPAEDAGMTEGSACEGWVAGGVVRHGQSRTPVRLTTNGRGWGGTRAEGEMPIRQAQGRLSAARGMTDEAALEVTGINVTHGRLTEDGLRACGSPGRAG